VDTAPVRVSRHADLPGSDAPWLLLAPTGDAREGLRPVVRGSSTHVSVFWVPHPENGLNK
jgi:hypothetical protein